MNENSTCGELTQLVQEEENEEPLIRGGEATPPSTPARPHRKPKEERDHNSHPLQLVWENKDNSIQASSIISKGSSSQATTSQGSMSGRVATNSSYTGNQSRLMYLNEKEKVKPPRPEPPRVNKQPKVNTAPCKHHSFLTEVPDVRHMEKALLQLLEDFHSGNLQAFGKDCSMEQMTEIREQQEKLAKLHFEMGQRQDHGTNQSGFRQSNANMRNLLQRLEQLSVCIEKLHSK
ncbi:coiled-coil domain-containing protein 28B isoform X2 [Phymastichus coffea]|uniref:coiled-coil domain-containing protein 28B isoform X2 n=1 Tax=Phymastichus coffea TaxID=108790 RepID=UPI00273BC060|nr:coiled-coil domain-containing protein 28B isoform X2 [Phymastichus coffea]